MRSGTHALGCASTRYRKTERPIQHDSVYRALSQRGYFDQLLRPGRDPRDDAPPSILRSDVLKPEDLKTGMRLKGTVRNVVDFGAFVDIGVKHDGLLHKSRLPRGAALAVGDVIDVTVLAVDLERERISLGWA